MESDKPSVNIQTICQHWACLKNNGGLKTYSKIHSSLVTGLSSEPMAVLVKKILLGRVRSCFVCKRMDITIHTCLHCFFFACARSGHMEAHFKETSHSIICELASGALYCFKCTDYIYEPDVVSLNQYNWRKVQKTRGISYDALINGVLFTNKHLQHGGTPGTCIVTGATNGLRGLVNLGNTCFMNSIIQTLTHTPLLRDFFLSSKIDCKSENHDSKQQKPCIITPFFELFQEFYNGSKNALSLHNLLYVFWRNAPHLARCEQQDAHEFFTAILDALHLHFAASFAETACKCIVDITFLGRLQSTVTCTICGHKSITVDPFWDSSLDIISDPSDLRSVKSIELEDVLRRYTRVEYLGPGNMIQCADCGRKTESTKQLHFQVLPKTLCLHLKRFEYSYTAAAACNKIDTCVRFPEKLDLTPFMANSASSGTPLPAHGHHYSQNLHHKNKRHRKSNGSTTPGAGGSNALYEKHANQRDWYHLYAVVNHRGSFGGGHYYAYIKHGYNQWFKCDDHVITKVSRDEVLNSPGYLLFYHKSQLPYKEDPNKLIMSFE